MASLAGRTVALVGLSREEMPDLTSALDAAGARWQACSDVETASAADLIIARAETLAEVSSTTTPLLVIGTLDAVSTFAADTTLPRDFCLAPARAEEILLRASHLLADFHDLKPRPPAAAPVVLAADDDRTTMAIVRTVVTQNGMQCHIANNGKSALDLAQALDPNVVILDVDMPFLDGFQVLTALRNEPRTAEVPVMMLTSMQQQADVTRAFSLGADDYVVKPFNPRELLARIRRLVKTRS
jgi:PleD family two-component response regulator